MLLKEVTTFLYQRLSGIKCKLMQNTIWGNRIEDRRSLYRFFPPFLNDQYFSREEKGSREQCVILNISRKGVGLKFHTGKKIKPGATIFLEMYVPRKSEPINLKGTLKWIEKEGNDFIGAIELTEALDDATWAMLF